ncbi:MAG: hypothetical protein F9K47_13045 [Burkholderiales bacterium]|nr:MAG: hypothetical protein F9K47_13045 [Burkholderiales bacterium]CAG1004227.1 hypothetical protein MYXO_03267 [Myxococcaceae bacterium]
MNTLRFRLDEAFAPDKLACDWVLLDQHNAALAEGRSSPKEWPTADAWIGIVASARARVLRLALPELPPQKFAAALAYAVETRIAGEPQQQQLVAGRRDADGKRPIVVIERAWLETALGALATTGVPLSRLVAEGELPERPLDAWWWQRAAEGGFVLLSEDALPLDDASAALDPPAALVLALERSGAARPTRLLIAGTEPAPEQQLAWARALGLAIEYRPGGDWREIPAARLDAACDLRRLPAESERQEQAEEPLRLWRQAAVLFALAAGVHLGATALDFARLSWRAKQLENEARQLVPGGLAQSAGIPASAAAFRRLYAAARHAAGLPAAQDALPLLARAAPALAPLGEDALRQAHFASGRWTLDLPPLDGPRRQALGTALSRAGLNAIYAEQNGSLRILIEEQTP